MWEFIGWLFIFLGHIMMWGLPIMFLLLGLNHILSLNKKTGEVRKYNSFYTVTEGSKSEKWFGTYRVTIPE